MSTIKTIVREAARRGWSVLGLRRGWEGLVHYDPEDPATASWLMPLTEERVRTIDRTGGTILHTSRIDPDRLMAKGLPARLRVLAQPEAERVDVTPAVLKAIEALGSTP